MTVTTGLSSTLPNALATLLSQYGTQADPSGTSASRSSAATTSALSRHKATALGSDPAFTLSLGNQDSANAMIGYNQLAQLGGKLETALDQTSGTGDDTTLQVQVHQLAQAQTVTSAAFGDADTVSLGSGKLSIETGYVDPSTGSFTASGQPLSIDVGGGTLTDIAQAVNDAKAGLAASVVEQSGGGYSLQITGQTGADNAFRLSGLSDLAFDPSAPQDSQLSVSSEAQDALYTVGGQDAVSATNTDVTVASGAVATFTRTGTQTVTQSALPATLSAMLGAFNTVQSGIARLTGDKGSLSKDANLAAAMFVDLGNAATAKVSDAGKFTSLADVGVSIQSDGTLSVDQDALSKAAAEDPTDLKTLIQKVSGAMDTAIAPYLGAHGAVSSQVGLLAQLGMRGNSLLDYLNADQSQGDSSGSGLAGLLNSGGSSGSSSSTESLLSLLGTNATTAALSSSSSASEAGMSSLSLEQLLAQASAGADTE